MGTVVDLATDACLSNVDDNEDEFRVNGYCSSPGPNIHMTFDDPNELEDTFQENGSAGHSSSVPVLASGVTNAWNESSTKNNIDVKELSSSWEQAVRRYVIKSNIEEICQGNGQAEHSSWEGVLASDTKKSNVTDKWNIISTKSNMNKKEASPSWRNNHSKISLDQNSLNILLQVNAYDEWNTLVKTNHGDLVICLQMIPGKETK